MQDDVAHDGGLELIALVLCLVDGLDGILESEIAEELGDNCTLSLVGSRGWGGGGVFAGGGEQAAGGRLRQLNCSISTHAWQARRRKT